MLNDETIELFAIRAAKGNNGGEWATHYNEDQKDYWRTFVRDMAASLQHAVIPQPNDADGDRDEDE
jgi:hypothetical protein